MQEELKTSLGEELVKQIEEKIKPLELKNIVSTANGEYVPRQTMNDEIEKKTSKLGKEIEGLNAQIEQGAKDLKSIQKKLEAGEVTAEKAKALQLEIAGMQEKSDELSKTHTSEMLLVKKKAEAKVELGKAGAVHPDMIISSGLIDFEKVLEIANGKYAGLSEQIKALKEGDYKDQFGEINIDGSGIDTNVNDPKPKGQLAQLEKEYNDAVEKFGLSSPQAISVKNEMYKSRIQSTANAKPEKT